VYNAYKRAVEHKGGPTVILAKTVKGYGLGSQARQRDASGKKKAQRRKRCAAFRSRFEIPIPEQAAHDGSLYGRPTQPRDPLFAGAPPGAGRIHAAAEVPASTFEAPPLEYYSEALTGSKGRGVSTTMAFVGFLRHLLKGSKIGRLIGCPFISRQGRTFGMESSSGSGNLRQPGAALQAGTIRTWSCTTARRRRSDSGGGHHGSGLHGVVHRGRRGATRTIRCR